MARLRDVVEIHADRLRAFLAVARARGFTRGAKALGRSQSSVSEAVSRLEQEVGEPLLIRDGRAVHLTDAGEVMRAHAERAFAELERARIELAARRDLQTGQLTLGSTDTLAIYLLPALFGAFRARYPGVDLRLVSRPSPALAQLVADREVDLAVVSLPLPSSTVAERSVADRVHIQPLVPQRDVVVCPPDHPLAHRKRLRIGDLGEHPLVLLDRSTGTRALLDAGFAEADITPKVAMEMNSVEVLKRLVELGFGLSVIPAMAIEREVAQGALVAIELQGLGPGRDTGLLTSISGPLSHAARAFVDLAEATLAE